MKHLSFIFLAALFLFGCGTQKPPRQDMSPHDIATFKKRGELVMRVLYGRPYKKDREIFGKVVKYGKVWRTGANESTEFYLAKDATVNGKLLEAGTYSLFTIPEKDQWTIIFNRELHKWGAFFYSEKDDVLRVEVPVSEIEETVESFSIYFEKEKGLVNMVLSWDKVALKVPFNLEIEKP